MYFVSDIRLIVRCSLSSKSSIFLETVSSNVLRVSFRKRVKKNGFLENKSKKNAK